MKTRKRITSLPLVLLSVVLLSVSFPAKSEYIADNNKTKSHRQSSVLGNFVVNQQGEIRVADDDKSIVSIGRGGYLEIIRRTFGNRRVLKISPDTDGSLKYEYKEGRRDVEFEPDGRRWMEEILPDVIRSAGIDIESRIKRFYASGGANAVLNEIKQINSDFVSAKYYIAFVEIQPLSKAEYISTIQSVNSQIRSDFRKSSIYINTVNNYMKDEDLSDAFFKAVGNLSSDFEKSKVLLRVDFKDINDAQKSQFLSACNAIKSNFEHSKVLVSISLTNFSENAAKEYLRSVAKIGSDFEKSKVLLVFNSNKILADGFPAYYTAAGTIKSDFELSKVLINNASKHKLNDINLSAFINCLDKIRSDFEKSKTIVVLLNNQQLSESNLSALISKTGKMRSDFEKSKTLMHIADKSNTDKLLAEICKTVRGMRSNFEKSKVLTNIASKITPNSSAEAEYKKAAGTISSDFEYGKVMRALNR